MEESNLNLFLLTQQNVEHKCIIGNIAVDQAQDNHMCLKVNNEIMCFCGKCVFHIFHIYKHMKNICYYKGTFKAGFKLMYQ